MYQLSIKNNFNEVQSILAGLFICVDKRVSAPHNRHTECPLEVQQTDCM